MTHTQFNNEVSESQVNDFKSAFCPFGFLDIKAAVRHAINAGEDADWAAEQIQNFMEECGITTTDKIDPVYCVMDSILQSARREIETLTSFDIMNDCNFDTYGNYMCSSFDYREEDKQALINKLAENEVVIEDLETMTQYFLDQVEISQSDIDNVKAAEQE